jgi:hypothetical protein
MYKYIKGKEVFMEEHMLSASEIAAMFGIYSNGKTARPHSFLVAAILREFIERNNLNISDYFYPHSNGVMKVYPELVWKKAMNTFVFEQDLESKTPEEVLKYKINNSTDRQTCTFTYQPKLMEQSKIININGRRNKYVDKEMP